MQMLLDVEVSKRGSDETEPQDSISSKYTMENQRNRQTKREIREKSDREKTVGVKLISRSQRPTGDGSPRQIY